MGPGQVLQYARQEINQTVQNVTLWIVARQIELSFGRLVCHEQIKLHFYIKEQTDTKEWMTQIRDYLPHEYSTETCRTENVMYMSDQIDR